MTLLGSQLNDDIRVQYYVNSEKKINMIVDTEGTIISGDSFSAAMKGSQASTCAVSCAGK